MSFFSWRQAPSAASKIEDELKVMNRTKRSLGRERGKLEKQEKPILARIRRHAESGDQESARIVASELAANRKTAKEYLKLESHISRAMGTIKKTKTMAVLGEAMRGVTRAMRVANSRISGTDMANIMQTFARESAVLEAKQEMMDDGFEDAGAESDEEAIVGQIMDEVNLSIAARMGAPSRGAVSELQNGRADADDVIAERLARLKK